MFSSAIKLNKNKTLHHYKATSAMSYVHYKPKIPLELLKTSGVKMETIDEMNLSLQG